jgi:predicted membrane protein (TIGR00267 family)
VTQLPRRLGRLRLLPPVLGFVDGILNALALAASAILSQRGGIGAGLALRVGVFSLVTAVFVLFVARYGELRSELVRQARQLNLLSHGGLAQTMLGRAVFREALTDATVSSVASFAGAVMPLAVAAGTPAHSWLAVVVALFLLGALGIALARTIHASAARWALTLVLGGLVLTAIGFKLRIA